MRLTCYGVTRGLLTAITAILIVACVDTATGPSSPANPRYSFGYPTNDTVADNCTVPPPDGSPVDNECHDGPVYYSLEGQDCPGGCYSFPMTPSEDDMMYAAFGHISDDGDCGRVKSFMMQMYRGQYIRNTYMGGDVADTHYSEPASSTTPNWHAAIHIDMQLESYYPSTELADTIEHEGFHAFFNNPDDPGAVDFARNCVI